MFDQAVGNTRVVMSWSSTRSRNGCWYMASKHVINPNFPNSVGNVTISKFGWSKIFFFIMNKFLLSYTAMRFPDLRNIKIKNDEGFLRLFYIHSTCLVQYQNWTVISRLFSEHFYPCLQPDIFCCLKQSNWGFQEVYSYCHILLNWRKVIFYDWN